MRSPPGTAFLLALAVMTFAPAAEAASRISTGGDLVAACRALSEHRLNPQGPTPRPALLCRKYIAGYLASANYVRSNGDAKEALDLPRTAEDCVSIDGPQSYDQLASRILRQAEWQPALLDRPAVELARAAFGPKPPC
ncbi:hypothetical protein [Parvibaculum sp.]|uniref:hypothetical protein n=1 Tax=Parvibaculum sp. TaxID=2024848 RepID=UPI00320D9C6A